MLKLTVLLLLATTVAVKSHGSTSLVYQRTLPLVPVFDGRIVGGKPTTIEKYPWQLSFLYVNGHNCGASIISSEWALTAAHCVDPEDFPHQWLTFRSGTSFHARDGTVHNISRIIIHEKYNASVYDYDIALVKVSNPFNLNSEKVSIVQLAQEGSAPKTGSIAQVTGWGRLKENGPIPDQLQEVEVPIISEKECKHYYGESRITNRMLCAGYINGAKDACGGDSGGPLVVNRILYGVVSWGRGCARPNLPGVYTHVGNLRSWIKQHSGI